MNNPTYTSFYKPERSSEKAICLTALFVFGKIEKRSSLWFPKSLAVEKNGMWAVQTWFAAKKIDEFEKDRVNYTGRSYWQNSFCCFE